MKTITADTLLTQLRWRYATKEFDPQRKIPTQDWATLEESLVLAPSSFGLQPWKFLVVNNPSLRARLVAASWGQRQVVDASHLVVFAIKRDLDQRDIEAHLSRIAAVRHADPASLGGYRDMMVGSILQNRDPAARRQWATNQVYIALGVFLTSAALVGIDACPMEGIEPAEYDAILGLGPQGLQTVVVAAAGFRAAGDKYAAATKVRFPRAEVLVQL